MTVSNSLQLITKRLRLELVDAMDLAILHAIFTDESVRQYLFDDEAISLSQTEEILNKVVASAREEQYGLWLIHEKSSLETVGIVGLYPFFSEPQPQLLYALLPRYQKQGFATEAAQAVIRYAFEELGYHYVKASCDVPNAASVAVMERLGMQRLKTEIVEGKPIVHYILDRQAYSPNKGQ